MDRRELNGLLALKLVAEKKSFTAASEELGISPQAISKMVKQLESRVGVAFLSRTTRSTSLTEAGSRFLERAGPALEEIHSALKDVDAYAAKPSGLLRLNLPSFSYPSVVAPLIKSFLVKYPEVSVELFFEDAPSDVVQQGFDAGVRISDILAKDMVAIKLFGPIRFVVVGSPKYLNKNARPKHPKDLLNHNCIKVRTAGNPVYDKWEFEHRGKATEVQIKGSLLVNETAQALSAAIDGIGLFYTTEDFVGSQVSSGKLEIVLNQYAPESDGYYLYYPKRSQVQPKLRAFIDHIRRQIHDQL